MTRMQNPDRLFRLSILGLAALMILAVPSQAQVPDLPIGASAASELSTPLGSFDGSVDDGHARVCADGSADGNAVAGQATGAASQAQALAGGLPVSAPATPALPVGVPATPSLPSAGADGCIDVDATRQSASADLCGEASGLMGVTGVASAAPVQAPALPISADGASGCAGAGLEDGAATASGSASAGPIQQAFSHTVDLIKELFGKIGF